MRNPEPRIEPDGETRGVCCYCGTGCGVIIERKAGRISGVRGDPAHPANFGRLCTKGSTLHLAAGLAGRALYPELRGARYLPRQRTDWASALDAAAARFADIIERHGPDAVAFYVSGQLLTEDYYVFNKLARSVVGTNNIDSNSRLCMSSAVNAYEATLGADSVPCSYEDLALTDHLLIAGSNTAWAHPVLFRRIEEARRADPDLFITVVDPRRTETAEFADLHLQIAPGADALLYNAMLHVLVWDELIDRDYIRAHTSGFEDLRARLVDYSPGNVATACGVAAADIIAAARRFGRARAALSLWCQGLNQSQHGVANNAALIHLHLATGHIGRAGAGPFSLTGQPNAMGGREAGAMASLLPAHRDPASAADRAEMARLWGVPSLPARPGLKAVELFDALADGRVKAVWIACTNPAQSLPHQDKVRAALAQAEFVVVQEAYADTETADFADLLLPAASWGEKSGTMTNSERRVSRARAAVAPPGEARADWVIAADFARRLARMLGRDEAHIALSFGFAGASDVFAEHAALSAGRDCDMSGLSHALLDAAGPQQWPYPSGATHGTSRLFGDGRFPTPDGRARFAAFAIPGRAALLPDVVDARHPFVLLSGRMRDQWHGMSRTGKVARLWGHAPRAQAHMNPADLERRGWDDGMLLRLANQRGELVLPVVPDPTIAAGQVWVPMHWGAAMLAQPGANALSSSATDPLSGQPALKGASVAISRFEADWRGAWALDVADAAGMARCMATTRPLLARFGYAALSVTGGERPVVTLHVAAAEMPEEALLDAVDACFGVRGEDATLVFEDTRRGVLKRVRIAGGELRALRLCGEVAAFDWLVASMGRGQLADTVKPWLFVPLDHAPVALPVVGRIICSCHGVAEQRIVEAIRGGADLPGLQTLLKCGSACGSCLPELRRLLADRGAAALSG
ncbi:MAG: molybdopterin-dependent oxidoreductase [Rhodocyclales bacterium]|nr:molybdopterin-dependent oxidoreductase [Rhodocyclales bacterium]